MNTTKDRHISGIDLAYTVVYVGIADEPGKMTNGVVVLPNGRSLLNIQEDDKVVTVASVDEIITKMFIEARQHSIYESTVHISAEEYADLHKLSFSDVNAACSSILAYLRGVRAFRAPDGSRYFAIPSDLEPKQWMLGWKPKRGRGRPRKKPEIKNEINWDYANTRISDIRRTKQRNDAKHETEKNEWIIN